MRTSLLRSTLVAALVAAALLPAMASPAAAAPEVPTCTVAMDSGLQTAHVTAVAGEILDFSGAINVTTGTTNPRSLLITAEISPGDWGAQVNPTSANVSNHQVVRFNSTVAVPPAANASTAGTLNIRAGFYAVPGIQSSWIECVGTSRIVVAQYYRVDIDTTNPRVELGAGEPGLEAFIIVHNLGNGRDGFTLDLEEPDYLLQVKLFTNLPRKILLDADQETTISFTINASGGASAGSYDVAVLMTSDAQPQSARDSLVVTVVVKETIIDKLIPDLTTGLIIVAVAAAGIGGLVVRRRVRQKREAREARRRLQQVLRQRREVEAAGAQDGGYEGAGEGGYDDGVVGNEFDPGGGDAPPPEGAPDETAPAEAAPERVRVRVKAPPKQP